MSPLPISALSGTGTGELLDIVCAGLKKIEVCYFSFLICFFTRVSLFKRVSQEIVIVTGVFIFTAMLLAIHKRAKDLFINFFSCQFINA